MKSRTLWNERLGMLAACGSPGSALAYHLGVSLFEPGMMRRNIATKLPADPAEQVLGEKNTLRKPDASGLLAAKNWFGRLIDRLETWSWEREMREREAYLARSCDIFDLEARMRELDGGTLSRGRALR